MLAHVEILNRILSLGTIFFQIIILLLIVNLIFFRNTKNQILSFFKKNTLLFGFLVGLGAVISSLFYSEIIGYPPCELCWIQRIFLYPQLILFGLGLYKKDWSIVDYSLIFAILGSITSIYHIYIENGGSSSLGCVALDSSKVNQISCSIRYIYEFGYITIPVMSLTLSLFIIMIILNFKAKLKVKM